MQKYKEETIAFAFCHEVSFQNLENNYSEYQYSEKKKPLPSERTFGL